jgi:hypothetical protein
MSIGNKYSISTILYNQQIHSLVSYKYFQQILYEYNQQSTYYVSNMHNLRGIKRHKLYSLKISKKNTLYVYESPMSVCSMYHPPRHYNLTVL